MGQIRKEKSGHFRVTVYDNQGMRHRKIFVRQAEAKAFLAMIESGKNDDRLIKTKLKNPRTPIELSFQELMNSKLQLRPKSVQRYTFIINQLTAFAKAVGINYLDDFNSDHATMFYNELIKEKVDPKGNTDRIMKPQPKTVNMFLAVARAFFRDEILKCRIVKNPFDHVKNLKTITRPPEFYSEQEINLFFKQEMPIAYRRAFLGLLFTGMRISELVNLTWNDVDLKGKLICVSNKAGYVTKTENSERTIPMNESLYQILMEIKGSNIKSEYPFTSIQGHKLSDRKLLEACKAIGLAAGIHSRIFLHKWRHTFATQLTRKRVPIESVQKLLGHSSIVETMIYAHIKSEDLHSDVGVLDGILNKIIKDTNS